MGVTIISDDMTVIDRFIESWGAMGSVWGINASTARIHALLMTNTDPMSLDAIAKRLRISRGNASMCLKELRGWGVIRLIKEPGDRRDYYVSESDVQKMFFAIAGERKRREFDPLVEVVEDTLRSLKQETGGRQDEVRARLEQMEELLSTLKVVGDRFLGNEKLAKSLLPLLLRSSRQAKQ